MKLVFTWIQWCWKWTQARLLVDNYGFTLLEMGQELRNIVSSWSELGLKIKWILESWALVSSDIVWEIMKEVLANQSSENLILDWFIRNEWNKKSLEELVDNYQVVFFELSKEKAIERLLGRMYNPNTGETFVAWTKVDPETWDELIVRKDDNEESILKRIDEYMNNTLPTVELQRKEWRVISINADQSISEVASEMVEKLWLNK
jgi:adenylate kinase